MIKAKKEEAKKKKKKSKAKRKRLFINHDNSYVAMTTKIKHDNVS